MAQVLLVEDNSEMLETLSFAMRSKGHSVVTADCGVDGMEKFVSDQFDLVVTDILMPDRDGLGLIAEMMQIVPNSKILAISGGGVIVDFDCLSAASKLGAMATLAKPFPINEFHDVVVRCSLA